MTELPTSDFFEILRDGPVVEMRMNRPDKANGMNMAFWDDLPVLMSALDADMSVRALVISGAGKHFSGGMDLAAFQSIHQLLSQEPGRAAYALRRLIQKFQASLSSLEQSRLPVIAAIHGACIGGAVDLICCCDVRLAAKDVRFAIEEINIGMAADVGTLQRLPKLIPFGIAAELALTGRRFGADDAAGWGLVNAVHEDADAVRAAARDLAAEIAQKSPLAIAGIKTSMTYARDHGVQDGLEQIAVWNAGMLRSEDLMRAIQARMTKAEADFADLLDDM
ncbi:crotonase/enoyl-CoA hydratase family protein [Marivita sp. S6314]|uniref:crotonase/enoyl-CoA hydratase family protein n=1 Tax=Marivita sp. S6314 TaxID=2926406 RepID=UPI001FF184D9|nr:crotonase/enoyl-CoA hydratase family protein [Marivita sp. S6314]